MVNFQNSKMLLNRPNFAPHVFQHFKFLRVHLIGLKMFKLLSITLLTYLLAGQKKIMIQIELLPILIT